MENDLKKLRQTIDSIDREIISLLSQRLDACYEVGKVKRKLKVNSFLDKNRWQQVLHEKKELGKSLNLEEGFIEQVYELIHQYALKIERNNKR